MPEDAVIVVGLGEVGKPLFELLQKRYRTFGVDIDRPAPVTSCDVMHICFPFQVKDFVGEVANYIEKYHPSITIINSTVAVGTTRRVAERCGTRVVNSPVRGKHARMQEEMLHYTKFIGALDDATGKDAAQHFGRVGMKTRVLSSPEATELAKLTETTYFGLLIAWAQEVERFCHQTGCSYDEVVSFYDEIKFFPPVKYFPGVIGGHCVMPNIEIMRDEFRSTLLPGIVESNRLREQGLAEEPHN